MTSVFPKNRMTAGVATLSGIVGLMALACANESRAATLIESVRLPVTLEYNTNPAMLANNVSGAWKLSSTPGIKVAAVNNVDEWYADFALRIDRSSNKTVLIDREDPSLAVGWNHAYERGTLGVDARYDEASSRTTELEETGLVQKDGTRTTRSIGVHLAHGLNEKMSLMLDGAYKKMNFSGGSTLGGNRSWAANARLNYAWTERLTPFVSASYSRFQPDVAGPDTVSLTGTLGATWNANDYWSYSAYWGMNKTTVGSADGTGWQGGASANLTGERTTAMVDYSRSTGSSGAANSISSDQVNGHWTYKMNDLASFGADLSWRKHLDASAAENRQIGAWYGRELADFWNLRFNCSYKQNITDVSRASAKLVGITFTYTNPNF